MCGITGFWLGKAISDPPATLHLMNDRLKHRGPDAGDIYFDPTSGVGLGHRRLAIIDLSPSGAQPMTSPSSRYVVVFNGEIYNYERLRSELGSGHSYRGHSDTEVMLHAFEAWGVENTIPRLFGMFAIAIWDKEEQRLILVRDRLGKKPLYFARSGDSLIFGSELKALRAFPGWVAEVDRDALTLMLRHNYIPAPHCIYKGASKLKPGSYISFRRAEGGFSADAVVTYWDINARSRASEDSRFAGTFEDAVDSLDSQLRDSVALRMVSDVPLGAFLSGGVDSSLICALMQAQSTRPIKTYTIGFAEKEYNEAPYAKAVAAHLGTDHTELQVKASDALQLLPQIPTMFDEPFSDSSQLPTALVCGMARKHVTVVLSGDGGDEGFCGYGRYQIWRNIWRLCHRVPGPIRKLAAWTIPKTPEVAIDAIVKLLGPILPSFIPRQSSGARLQALAKLAGEPSAAALYFRLISHWTDPATIVRNSTEPPPHPLFRVDYEDESRFIQHMSVLDAATYLPDDILTKVDRASMAVSLEARAPLLDHRIMEFAWSLPVEFKLDETRNKRILWELLYRYVPKPLVDRPKLGFGVPIDYWLRGTLRDWAESLLAAQRLENEGFFDPTPIRKMWDEHLSGKRDWHYHLWDVLMFQAWNEEQRR